ncbi:MAG: cellulase family glycosylhydrolase [Kiritimatiellae bacterium]|nr:cellulase family glycosylhydrolase [Kiritimatiellia bacterium]
MMTLRSLSSLLAAALLAAAGVYAQEIAGTSLSWSLSRFARIEGDILTVDVPPDCAKEGGSAVAMVDMTPIDGQCFSASVRCRGENISKPFEHWNGLKFQFEFRDVVTGETVYPNTKSRLGTFPEETISTTVVDAGSRLEKAKLTLGLQSSSGKVVFDLSTLRIRSGCDLFPATNQDWVVRYSDNPAAEGGTGDKRQATSGDAESRNVEMPSCMSHVASRLSSVAAQGAATLRRPLRGCMSPGRRDMTEDDFRTLHEWGATLLRYQTGRSWDSKNDQSRELADYMAWLDGRLDHLDRDILPWAEKYGVHIIVDLHAPPGGRSGGDMNMFYDMRWNDAFVEVWRKIARRFKGRPMIYGYDLVNEPKQSDRAICDYWNTQRRAAEAIREIDPDATIVVEANGYAAASAFAYLSPLAMDNVVYQVHMYEPFAFTHQGIHKGFGPTVYPDEGKGWNREYLARRLAPVVAFQKKHGARILVGEFSAVAWADGAEKYLADLISLFNEYGWDWTYHAFRESPCWDVEKAGPSIPKMVPVPDTPRKRALLDGFAK